VLCARLKLITKIPWTQGNNRLGRRMATATMKIKGLKKLQLLHGAELSLD